MAFCPSFFELHFVQIEQYVVVELHMAGGVASCPCTSWGDVMINGGVERGREEILVGVRDVAHARG